MNRNIPDKWTRRYHHERTRTIGTIEWYRTELRKAGMHEELIARNMDFMQSLIATGLSPSKITAIMVYHITGEHPRR